MAPGIEQQRLTELTCLLPLSAILLRAQTTLAAGESDIVVLDRFPCFGRIRMTDEWFRSNSWAIFGANRLGAISRESVPFDCACSCEVPSSIRLRVLRSPVESTVESGRQFCPKRAFLRSLDRWERIAVWRCAHEAALRRLCNPFGDLKIVFLSAAGAKATPHRLSFSIASSIRYSPK
jgi:hypothetical protein